MIAKQKKILFLGASYAQIPIIKEARKRDYYICTCDYLPSNPGHKLADEYYNVSTTDYEGVLSLAKRINPDFVVAYASDPSAPIAAFVAEQLGLPGNPHSSVLNLGVKDLFRKLMKDAGLNSPRSIVVDQSSSSETISGLITLPAILKPTDSCGSKGVVLINHPSDLNMAIKTSIEFSRNGRLILEEYVDNALGDVHGDGFVVDGQLSFHCMGDHLYDEESNPFNPKGTIWPSILSESSMLNILNDVSKIIKESGFRNGPINIEARVNSQGKHYVMEIGPRSGGFFVPQAIHYATGFDMVTAMLDSLEGKEIEIPAQQIKPTAYYAIHSSQAGKLAGITISDELSPFIVEKHYYKREGDDIHPYTGGNAAIGVLLLIFESIYQMQQYMSDIDNHVRVDLA